MLRDTMLISYDNIKHFVKELVRTCITKLSSIPNLSFERSQQ